MIGKKKTKIIVTLGPATKTEADLRRLKDKGVDFVRVNMSHSSEEDLKYFIDLAKKVGLEFIIDTEGSQVRTGKLKNGKIKFSENDKIEIHKSEILGDEKHICLKPGHIVEQLELGDLLYIDFDAVIVRISDVGRVKDGYIKGQVISEGTLGSNKAVVIHSGMERKFNLPALSEKDYRSIDIGLKQGIGYIAASFIRNQTAIEEVKRVTRGKMKIISKIECVDALENLDEIIEASDFLLIDRGDLSKEIPIEKIPFTQKIIIARAQRKGVGVFVATNLLESMIENKKPTRAEVHDITKTILDGAMGLTLAAETAIGKYPMECINTLNKIIRHTEQITSDSNEEKMIDNWLVEKLEKSNYLLDKQISPTLIPPHGGRLVNRILKKEPTEEYLSTLPKIIISPEAEMDVEQIAIGTFSPLEGFMCRDDFYGVLNNMRLTSGLVWPLPIVLDISEAEAADIFIGNDVVLLNRQDQAIAILHVEDKYDFDKNEVTRKLYGTNDLKHPGVAMVNKMKPMLVGGKIDLIRRRQADFKEYELTPAQVRRLFEEKGWSKIVGFHTRNVIHRSHEFIQLQALDNEYCDGLFVHPVIGKKKTGDFNAKYIIASYEKMIKDFYPKNKVVFSVFATFSRYAGPREALFTALCRKNFGCSHFIVGRDHTGVGEFYPPYASQEIFDRFDDLGIVPLRFGEIFYSEKLKTHVHENDFPGHPQDDRIQISGTQARKIFEEGGIPPEWFMRPEISELISNAIKNDEEVFMKSETASGRVLWFTGLSGSGKTTLAQELKKRFESLGKKTEIIDADAIRNSRNRHLGFSRDDIRENNRIIAGLAKEKSRQADFVLVPIISPYAADRQMAREIIGERFFELFINCPLEECIKKDVKGLYKKAIAGEISDLIGFSDANPYETPLDPDIEIFTHQMSIGESASKIMEFFKKTSFFSYGYQKDIASL